MAGAGFPVVEQLGQYKVESWPAPLWVYQVRRLGQGGGVQRTRVAALLSSPRPRGSTRCDGCCLFCLLPPGAAPSLPASQRLHPGVTRNAGCRLQACSPSSVFPAAHAGAPAPLPLLPLLPHPPSRLAGHPAARAPAAPSAGPPCGPGGAGGRVGHVHLPAAGAARHEGPPGVCGGPPG